MSSMRRRSFFNLQNLIFLALVTVFAASGIIRPQDIAFVVLSTLYLYFISQVSFPASSSDPAPPVYGGKNTILRIYVAAGGIIGLVLPVAYILGCVLDGDNEGIKAAASPVFLLACQVIMEGVSFSGRLSLPVRVFVSVFYNSWRMLSILEWVASEFSDGALGRKLANAGRGLAVANVGFWSFNLLGFLLPFYLPKAFKIYYTKAIKKED